MTKRSKEGVESPQRGSEKSPEERSGRIVIHQKVGEPGPLIIALGGMHGNEAYGVPALKEVDSLLSAAGGITRGEWIGLAANTAALTGGKRYIDEDMNRIWHPSIIDKIRRTPKEQLATSERREIKDLLEIMDPVLAEPDRQVVFVDLHSFSAPGGLFLITSGNPENIGAVGGLNVPLIFGIDDVLPGSAIRYMQDLGNMAVAFEGGGHYEARTPVNMVSFLLLLSARLGVIKPERIDGYAEYKTRLEEQSRNLPGKVKLVYQHLIEDGDEFVMRPGFENFQPLGKGEWLADDVNGRILSPSDGYMLMPLYQSQGDDGFFIVRRCDEDGETPQEFIGTKNR